jgi:predicted N-acetyltransferase YhbS
MTDFDISARAADPDALAKLLDLAFGPGRLARTAERLREGNQRITAYDHIAEGDDHTLVGAISFWPLMINATPGLLLGPLAVHPKMQGQGVGQKLMQDALAAINADRFAFALLVGDLPYYEKVGFAIAPTGVKLPGPVDPQRLLLRPSAPAHATLCAGLSGLVRRAPELC